MPNKGMPVKNILRKLIKENNITPYAFWKAIEVGQATAYRLCGDPDSVPGKRIMDKIYEVFGWLPGDYLVSDDEWKNWLESLPDDERAEVLSTADSYSRKTTDGRFKRSEEIVKLPDIAA